MKRSSNSSIDRIEASIEACLSISADNSTAVADISENQHCGLGIALTSDLSSQDSSLDTQNTTSHSHDRPVLTSSTTTIVEGKFGSHFQNNNPYRAFTTTRHHSNS